MHPDKLNFDALFQAIQSPLLIVDTDFHIVTANRAFEAVCSLSMQNLRGRYIFEVFPDNPNDPSANGVENLTASFNRVIKNKIPDQMPIQKYDVAISDSENGGFQVRYWNPINTPLFDSHGNVTHILQRVEDVTEQVLGKYRESELNAKLIEHLTVQKRLYESEFQAREIANNLPMIVWTARPDGYVDWYNDWWYEYLGQPRGTEWDDPKTSPMHPDDVPPTLAVWNECLRTGNFYTMEQRFRRATDGEYRWHVVRGIPIRNEHGIITKWIGGNTDIHVAKCLAQELSLAKQELEEKSRLLETV
ncbi:MAG: PAS domain-containing protein, partial [Bdellovibrionota bacterium]